MFECTVQLKMVDKKKMELTFDCWKHLTLLTVLKSLFILALPEVGSNKYSLVAAVIILFSGNFT